MVPTTEMIRAAIENPFLPFKKKEMIDSKKAIGRRIHPTVSAPGIQAKMKPINARTKAMIPITFLPRFRLVWSPSGPCPLPLP